MTKKNYYVAKEFTDSPGGNTRDSGLYSGQEFYEDHLQPIVRTLREDEILVLNFDGVLKLAPSFVSEAFGRLYSDNGEEKIRDKVYVESSEDLTLFDYIKSKSKKYEKTTG